MAKIDFSMVITNEAIQYAREASLNPGWYLTPFKWGISTTSGELSVERTTESMFTTWIQQPFSGVRALGTNKLLHSVVIPPDAYGNDIVIGEIYFIYKDYYGNEFLYAIAQPTTTLVFTPGVSQSYSFLFTLNNTTVDDTFTVEYTYPQDIEDHNQKEDSHENLLARNGSRTATGILQYDDKKQFSNPRDIVDKEYVDFAMYNACPTGSLFWWPSPNIPNGWLVRNGAAYSRTTYKDLFDVIGTIYGEGDGSTTFNVPNDQGLFIRGYQPNVSAGFGQIQKQGIPNIVGTFGALRAPIYDNSWLSGAFTIDYQGGTGISHNNVAHHTATRYKLDASASNSAYGAANEVRPANRNYLPIIKY